ncbi:MAG: DUF4193 domain-containing protein [Micromonosporaceae bacterium]
MSKPIDYDAPRRTAAGLEDDGVEELNALSAVARSPGVDLDEAEAAESFDLPGADLFGEELTVAVVPVQSDEFRCARCFLVQHRSQLAVRSNGQEICLECS